MLLLADKTGLPAPIAFIFGGLIIAFECWVGYSTLTRWEWFRTRYSWIARWGNSLTGIPASRIGVLYLAMTGMFIGFAMISSAMHWELPQDSSYFIMGVILWMIAGPLVFVRDCGLNLDNKDE
jgi:hypothetical protein